MAHSVGVLEDWRSVACLVIQVEDSTAIGQVFHTATDSCLWKARKSTQRLGRSPRPRRFMGSDVRREDAGD